MAKKNMRNEFEFMASVLDALGVEYEEADIKVRERWRGKVLEGWGVSYIPDDVKQFERWRGKCIEGLSKGGGGKSWELFYDGTVTTIGGGDGESASVIIDGYYTDADSIRVTFDGVEYIIPKTIYYNKPAYGEFSGEIIRFENYPFAIYFRKGSDSRPDQMTVLTPEAGTHVIKIETPKNGSGGFDPSNYEILEFTEDPNVTGRYICEKTFKEIYDDTNTNYAIYLDPQKFPNLYNSQFVKGGYYTLACKNATEMGTPEDPTLEYDLAFNLVGYGGEKSLQAITLNDFGTESEYFEFGNIVS